MAWYKVYKIFRGGKSKPDYIEVPKYTKAKDVEGYARDWAKSSPGGHNYGWTVYWSKIKNPPKKWLIGEIEDHECSIGYYKERIKELKSTLNKEK